MTKPIQIRNEGIARDIREAAALTHRSMTEVVGEGVRLVLESARRRTDQDSRGHEIDRILAEYRSLPKTGRMLTDDDLYDDDGLPK